MAILDAVESRVCCSGYNSDYATEYSPLSSGTECGGEGESPRRDWETRLGHGAALSLSILEIKRLLLLSLEMLIDSRPVRFAGALAPLLVSFCDVGLGFPVAVATLYALRRRRSSCGDDDDDDSAKDRLRRRICMLCLCVTLNVVTLVLIAVHVDTDASSLEKVFRMSMKFYAQEASHKLAVDDLQLDLECCGFSSYSDWFGVDWQEKIGTMYYADSEEEDDYPPAAAVDDGAIELEDEQTQRMDFQTVVDRGVPYSCCAKWILVPCAPASPIDPRTLNQGGCAAAIAAVMLRLAVVGYLVTALVIFSQILLVLLLCRIVKKMTEEAYKSECSCWESSCTPSSDAYLSQRQSAKSSLRRYRKANRQRLLRLAASRGGSSKLLLPPSRYRRRQFFKSTTSLCTNDDAAPTSIFSNSEGESSATSPSSRRGESTTANTDRGMMSCG
ncbi:uncharacterized protein LOC106652180 [Trichogramma pretiosum]|uniref:uncharacterized protein LOC106652180 n=1 Tax=Trichogramma pretiosum TaxID=7493 RepID=UPI0006C98981|nr:uncharacterized protein LOC106652180 [Trichogramma pretiosum]